MACFLRGLYMGDGGDVFRCGAAAAAQDRCAVVAACLNDGGKFLRCLVIPGDAVSVNGGNARIGFADQRALHIAP